MALPDEFLERLKQSNDIVSVVNGVVPELKRAGRDFVCLCPFHSEKSPSFHIYTDTQSFFCFGCDKGGSVITFIQESERLSYMDAVRLLAERSGIPVPEDDGVRQDTDELKKRSRIYEMNREAAKFFRDCLIAVHDGRISEGLAFLRERGLNDNTIRKYGLGYAPDSWNALKYHMNSLGYNDLEMVEASLLKQNEKGNIYDMFRGRVMFPVIDRFKNIIAFSGRIVNEGGEFKAGKYINSSATAVYKKGKHIFSINFAKNSERDYVILCEGNMDAVMLNQVGFDNAVAVLGIALTPEQIREELRFYWKGKDVIIAYDCDKAGKEATEKTINLLKKEGMSARVLTLNDAKDPDEYIKKFGADSFAALIEKSDTAIAFELGKIKSGIDTDTPEGRAEYLEKATDFLAGVENPYTRRAYAPEVARDCEENVAWVRDRVEYKTKSKKRFREKDERRELLRPSAMKRDTVNPDSRQFPVQEKAERGIIAFLFHSPDKLPVILRNLSPGDFPTAFNRKLFETLILRLNKRQSISIVSLGDELSAEEVGRIESIKIENREVDFTDKRLNDYINVLLDYKSSKSVKNVSEMSNDELLAYAKSLKEKKSVKVGSI